MNQTPEAAGAELELPMIHHWDTQAHRNACGAPGQTGSTKHGRGVTCTACLTLMGRPPAEPLHAVE